MRDTLSKEEMKSTQDTQNTSEESQVEEPIDQSQEADTDQDLQEELTDDARVEELQVENEELSDKVLRLQAEIQNLQRRNKLNREDLLRFRSQDLARDVIPAIDNLERALQIQVDDEAGENMKKGLQMVLQSLIQALNNNHVEVIDPVGETFDPNFHEAYTQLPAQEGQESGQVAEVFEKGYKLHDRVLRAAKVAVVQ